MDKDVEGKNIGDVNIYKWNILELENPPNRINIADLQGICT